MNDCKQLLNFSFNYEQFVKQGSEIIKSNTVKVIQWSLAELQTISQKHSGFKEVSYYDALEIYRLFFRKAPQGFSSLNEAFANKRNVRRLAWYLTISERNNPAIINSEYFKMSLELFHNKWQDSMFLALFDSLLKCWHSADQRNKLILIKFLSEKINTYTGKRHTILKIQQSNRKFFLEINGGVLLGGKLFQENVSLKDVLDYCELPKHMLIYEYWSDVATTYTVHVLKSNKLDDYYIDSIYDFLKNHNNLDTSKKCLVKIIIKCNTLNDLNLQKKIQVIAYKLIGDPANEYKWAPWSGANDGDKREIEQARRILNEWITREFINLFFEKIAIDEDRKEFWLRYTKHISFFKIYCRPLIQQSLYRDERINQIAVNRVGTLKGSGGSELSAFIMVINNYVLIEFSAKNNACYAYKENSDYCPDISKHENYISHLKLSGMAVIPANYRYGYYTEGRLYHKKYNWQEFFAGWLYDYVGV